MKILPNIALEVTEILAPSMRCGRVPSRSDVNTVVSKAEAMSKETRSQKLLTVSYGMSLCQMSTGRQSLVESPAGGP